MMVECTVYGMNSETYRRYWLVPVLGLSLAIGATLALGGADVVAWLISRSS